jgi:hypothetical protein
MQGPMAWVDREQRAWNQPFEIPVPSDRMCALGKRVEQHLPGQFDPHYVPVDRTRGRWVFLENIALARAGTMGYGRFRNQGGFNVFDDDPLGKDITSVRADSMKRPIVPPESRYDLTHSQVNQVIDRLRSRLRIEPGVLRLPTPLEHASLLYRADVSNEIHKQTENPPQFVHELVRFGPLCGLMRLDMAAHPIFSFTRGMNFSRMEPNTPIDGTLWESDNVYAGFRIVIDPQARTPPDISQWKARHFEEYGQNVFNRYKEVVLGEAPQAPRSQRILNWLQGR